MELKQNLGHCRLLILLLSVLFWTTGLYSQVTVGSNIEPNPGALLDIKEKNTHGENSTKGMLLPRVNLNKATILPPLSATYDGDNVLQVHVGLWVYNMRNTVNYQTRNNDDNICEGPYVWDGDRWVRLWPECICQYAVLGRQDEGQGKKTYWFPCQDFENIPQSEAVNTCKRLNNQKHTYHLMTYEEYEQVWSEPVIASNPIAYSFEQGNDYFLQKKNDSSNPQGWITVGYETTDVPKKREVLGYNKSIADAVAVPANVYFPGGTPIGGELGSNTVRCVRD